MLRVAIVAVLAAACIAAVPQDPVAWSVPLADTQIQGTPAYAVNSLGFMFIVDNTSIVAINTKTGTTMWSFVPSFSLDGAVFAATEDTLAIAASTSIYGYRAMDGRSIGFATLAQSFTTFTTYRHYFVGYATNFVAVLAEDLSTRYSDDISDVTVATVGFQSNFVYYTLTVTASSSASNSTTSNSNAGSYGLKVIDMTTWSTKFIPNVEAVSASGVDNSVAVIAGTAGAASLINLDSGATIWSNPNIQANFSGVFGTTTTFLVSSSFVILFAPPYVVGLDGASGDLFFNISSSASSMSFPTIVDGRLVYMALGQASPATFFSVDMATGLNIANITVATEQTPAVAYAGGSIIAVNGQGYIRINALTMEASAYNLNIPGSNGVAVIPNIPALGSATAVLIGTAGATAVTFGL